MSDNKKVKKSIRITSDQEANWNPDQIRDLLSGDFKLVKNGSVSDINNNKTNRNVGQIINPSEMSDTKISKISICCNQLIFFFDNIFDFEYSERTLRKLLEQVRKIDKKLVDEVRTILE